jgi:antitoxin ParD1/3/4
MTQMIRKTISLPQGMANFIQSRLQSGLYGNDSEYFRELVRADQKAQEKEIFQTMIERSMASGLSENTLDDIFNKARIRAKALTRDGL